MNKGQATRLLAAINAIRRERLEKGAREIYENGEALRAFVTEWMGLQIEMAKNFGAKTDDQGRVELNEFQQPDFSKAPQGAHDFGKWLHDFDNEDFDIELKLIPESYIEEVPMSPENWGHLKLIFKQE